MSLFTAFKSNDSRNLLLVTSSENGKTWLSSPVVTNNSTSAGPAMAVFQEKLYIAFKSNDSSNLLLVISSEDGTTWQSSPVKTNNSTSAGPAMAVFQDKLYIAFKSNDSNNLLLVTSSEDGKTWQSSPVKTNNSTSASPAMAVFQDKLYIAFKSNDSRNLLLVTSSEDCKTWQYPPVETNNSTSAGPAMALFQGKLDIAFKSNDDRNLLLVISSEDGKTWQSSPVETNNSTSAGPAMACNSISISNVLTPSGYTSSIFGGEIGTDKVGPYVLGNPITSTIRSVYFLGIPGLGCAALQFQINENSNYDVTFYGGVTTLAGTCMPGESIRISVDITGAVVLSVGSASVSSSLATSMGQSILVLQLMFEMISYSPSLQASWNKSAINTIYSMGFEPCLLNNLDFQCLGVSPDCSQQFSAALQSITFPGTTDATERVDAESIACSSCTVTMTAIALVSIGALVSLGTGTIPQTAAEFADILSQWRPFTYMCGLVGYTPSPLAASFGNLYISLGAAKFIEQAPVRACESLGYCP